VATVAQRYELNPNVVFAWRRLFRTIGKPDQSEELIPVNVIQPNCGAKRVADRASASASTTDGIEILLAEGARVRLSGALAREALREIIAAVFVR
jgi:transposase-like protein